MEDLKLKKLLLGTSLLTGMAMFGLTNTAYAQETEEDVVVETVDEAESPTTGNGDEVVVTGSRIKKSTFTSISPIQVITTDFSQDVGLLDPATILQTTESAAGQQIDATFQGFVLDNGPGSQTVNLRGLGADRTLLLLNGRRLSPAGVQGAPSSPSANLLPGSLIERNELLLDGASSVYGSDAVAGVINVILKKDFEGFEAFASGNLNEQGGGNDYTVSGSWGKNVDRGFLGIGAEYDFRDEVQLGDRDFLAGCDTHYELTDSGEIRTVGIRDRLTVEARTPGVSVSDNACKVSGISGRIFSPFQSYGSIYYTPGAGNSGIAGFSESTIGGVDIDANGDGIRDVDFQNVNVNGALPQTTFISEQKRISLMAFGEYTMEGDANLKPYFETLYVEADIGADFTGQPQLFPTVPASNPFNPCNLANNDCAAAEVTLLGRPGVNSGFSLPTVPIAAIRGDRNNFDVDQSQFRFVGGVAGDLPFMDNFGSFSDWTFDVSGVYSRSEGKSSFNGIREDRLAFALGIDPTADFDGDGIIDNDGDGVADDYDAGVRFMPTTGGACNVAGLSNPTAARPDLVAGCVPVDLFNGSVLGGPIGDFATQAERDYVFGTARFNTVYEQTIFNAFATGQIAELPAGPLAAVVGFEYRHDEIDSRPDVETSNGLFVHRNSDKGAVGEKYIIEAFGELDIPIVADKPFFKQLEANVSGRVTNEEFYGTAGTYSVKGGWRPVDSLLLKASLGTSFRAPNLRENFLAGQTGFNSVIDPCAVPDAAQILGVYQANLDTRDQATRDNCTREGRDPTTVGLNTVIGNTVVQPSIEIISGGALDLEPETSRSITVGASWEQPFYDSFDFSFNINYFDIDVKQAVITPSRNFIVADCFLRQDGVRSAFCDRISYDNPATTRGLISAIDGGFINQDQEIVRGLDLNSTFRKEFQALNQNFDFRIDFRANHLIERTSIFIDANGNVTRDEDEGEFGFPDWTGRTTFNLGWDKWNVIWQARYIGDVEQQADGIDPFDDAFGSQGTGFLGDTCAGPANGDVLCRDVGFADDYMIHTASVRYRADSWTLRAGVTNLFDKAPPLVDSNEVFAISNTPIGNGYDLNGREFFFTASKKF